MPEIHQGHHRLGVFFAPHPYAHDAIGIHDFMTVAIVTVAAGGEGADKVGLRCHI